MVGNFQTARCSEFGELRLHLDHHFPNSLSVPRLGSSTTTGLSHLIVTVNWPPSGDLKPLNLPALHGGSSYAGPWPRFGDTSLTHPSNNHGSVAMARV